jgi:hypothetical protein
MKSQQEKVKKKTSSKVAKHDDKKNAFPQSCGSKINGKRIRMILRINTAMVAFVTRNQARLLLMSLLILPTTR